VRRKSRAGWSCLSLARYVLLFLCLSSVAFLYYAYNNGLHLISHGGFPSRFDQHESTDSSERCKESNICDFQPSERACNADDQGLECVKSSRKRQEFIVEATRHAFKAYKDLAWGKDEAMVRQPDAWSHMDDKLRVGLLGDIGLTLIDSLDTLLLMNLTQEFSEARQWLSDPGPNGYKHTLEHSASKGISTFEANIRVMGAFLSTFALTGGDDLFLDLAIDFAERILPAVDRPLAKTLFLVQRKSNASSRSRGQRVMSPRRGSSSSNTRGHDYYIADENIHRHQPSHQPSKGNNSYLEEDEGIDWAAASKKPNERNLAEVGTLSMELTTLSHWTGREEFGEAGMRFFRDTIKGSPGIRPRDGLFCTEMKERPVLTCNGFRFSFGACSDSYYEYLLKQWVLSGSGISSAFDDVKEAYVQAIKGMRKHLLAKVNLVQTSLVAQKPRVPSRFEISMMARGRHYYYSYLYPIARQLPRMTMTLPRLGLPRFLARLWPDPRHTDLWIVTSGEGSFLSSKLYEEQEEEEAVMEITQSLDLEHLTCFVPGLMALGHMHGLSSSTKKQGRLNADDNDSSGEEDEETETDEEEMSEGERVTRYQEDDLTLASRLMPGCYELYRATPTGLGLDWITFVEQKSARGGLFSFFADPMAEAMKRTFDPTPDSRSHHKRQRTYHGPAQQQHIKVGRRLIVEGAPVKGALSSRRKLLGTGRDSSLRSSKSKPRGRSPSSQKETQGDDKAYQKIR
jgi:hypothetical protein